MPGEGFEPSRVAPPHFECGASAISPPRRWTQSFIDAANARKLFILADVSEYRGLFPARFAPTLIATGLPVIFLAITPELQRLHNFEQGFE